MVGFHMKWDPLPIHHTKKSALSIQIDKWCQSNMPAGGLKLSLNSCCCMMFPDTLQATNFRHPCSTSGGNWLSGFRRSLHLGRSRGSVGNQVWECHHGTNIVMVHFPCESSMFPCVWILDLLWIPGTVGKSLRPTLVLCTSFDSICEQMLVFFPLAGAVSWP